MENIIKQQTWIPNPPPPSALAMHRDSHTISKAEKPPKIRIIHIFAPEIIKTDVANFRELVQRLTGKPTPHDHQKKSSCRIRKPGTARARREEPPAKKMELRGGFGSRDLIKGEEEVMWNDESSDGYLGGFADLDGFIQELGEFPFIQDSQLA
ncbi:putative VQ motif-containing protein [Tripterygium wilfordii]|uniref:Putative VQ motif-containing protein n=1 Tax=Tripterygium wilfordii TaxID=458696 RepID=A0A7J7DN59_TRIWF|nr:putative VQ motif-containing protein [Tripterygium wilfordii]